VPIGRSFVIDLALVGPSRLHRARFDTPQVPHLRDRTVFISIVPAGLLARLGPRRAHLSHPVDPPSSGSHGVYFVCGMPTASPHAAHLRWPGSVVGSHFSPAWAAPHPAAAPRTLEASLLRGHTVRVLGATCTSNTPARLPLPSDRGLDLSVFIGHRVEHCHQPLMTRPCLPHPPCRPLY
jgi:hypothetical protein